MGSMAEVQLAQPAERKAQSPEVKSYAHMLAKNHQAADAQLKPIAMKEKVDIPTDLDDHHKDTIDKLSKLSGAEFDREHINAMVDDHRGNAGRNR